MRRSEGEKSEPLWQGKALFGSTKHKDKERLPSLRLPRLKYLLQGKGNTIFTNPLIPPFLDLQCFRL